MTTDWNFIPCSPSSDAAATHQQRGREAPLAVRIRLARVGATKRPSYRVVVIDSRKPRDGRALEIIGHYDPLTEPATVKLDGAKVASWMAKGATPSETVAKLMKLAGVGSPADAAAAAPAAPAPPVKPARARKPAARATAKAAE